MPNVRSLQRAVRVFGPNYLFLTPEFSSLNCRTRRFADTIIRPLHDFYVAKNQKKKLLDSGRLLKSRARDEVKDKVRKE